MESKVDTTLLHGRIGDVRMIKCSFQICPLLFFSPASDINLNLRRGRYAYLADDNVPNLFMLKLDPQIVVRTLGRLILQPSPGQLLGFLGYNLEN